MTYLSELFLEKVGTDFSEESVKQAILACDKEYQKREEISKKELYDFLDVYFEFHDDFRNMNVPLLREVHAMPCPQLNGRAIGLHLVQ